MNIARPRLLAGSLAVAVVVIAAFAVFLASQNQAEDAAPDSRLADPQTVVTFPNDGLANEDLRGDPFPVVDVGDRDGNAISTAAFVGDPLVVNFWFSTCPPCARELPEFAEVHGEVGDEVRFIGVNTIDSVQVLERFAGERGVTYEQYLDEFAEFTDAIGASSFPITIFVTPEGRIVEQKGVLDADGLRAEIDKLLEGA